MGYLILLGCLGSLADQASAPAPLDAPGIENFYRLSPRLYSGGQPEGRRAFEWLKALGIRTIVSVDGAAPDVESARRLGLRYVHLPVGYDGIPREQAVRLILAMRTLPGPVLIHCHHGKHRGPAAAALCGMAAEGWTAEQAQSWLKQAGTAPAYKGLFASVREFVAPSGAELDAVGQELPERAPVPDLVESMVRIDATWDRLRAVAAGGPSAHLPDVDAAHEALQLVEQLREAARLPEAIERGRDFERALESATRSAAALEEALRHLDGDPTRGLRREVEAASARVEHDCKSCHSRFRDSHPAARPTPSSAVAPEHTP